MREGFFKADPSLSRVFRARELASGEGPFDDVAHVRREIAFLGDAPQSEFGKLSSAALE